MKYLIPHMETINFPIVLLDGVSQRWNCVLVRCSLNTVRGECTGVLKVKVKCTLVQALRLCTGRTPHRISRGIALLFLDHDNRRGEGQRHASVALYPRERPGTHLQRLDGPQGRSRQVRKISPPLGFDPRTVQPVASRHTEQATRPTGLLLSAVKFPHILNPVIDGSGEIRSSGAVGRGEGRRQALGERPSGVQSQAGHCDEGNSPVFAGSPKYCSLSVITRSCGKQQIPYRRY